MENLMSPSFGRYVKHIEVVAAKPTVFRIELINNQDFTITYIGKKHFKVKVSGKKYNPENLGELERASQAIADLLELNYAVEEGKDQSSATPDAGLASDMEKAAEAPPAEASPAEAPPEETPPA
jgi:hypothetical protein